MDEGVYRFPANQRAAESTLANQLRKVNEEAAEASQAFLMMEGQARIIEELWDVIQAAEGALRMFPLWHVEKGRAFVVEKSQLRGDYEGVEYE